MVKRIIWTAGVLVGAAAALAAAILSRHLKRAAADCRAYRERIVAIGFDDFRASDFSLVHPLFKAYGATATFNCPPSKPDFDDALRGRLAALEADGNEIGDHTWFHWNNLFDDPLSNGQDPAHPEGGQTPFPSNAQMRDDRGDGKNVFGFPLTDSVDVQLSDFWNYGDQRWTAFDNTWGALTDEQCQKIRNYYAIYGNPCGFLDVFDTLSNRYLGTKGRSRGSWDASQNCYTGGVFTGCRTSANHEIWERVLQFTRAAYRAQHRKDFRFDTWSWPGAYNSPFFFRKNGVLYHDAACTQRANALARFPSSLRKDAEGHPLARSWTEALRSEGYVTTHDMTYPGRRDRYAVSDAERMLYPADDEGAGVAMMRHQMFFNAAFSRRDALAYSTERSVSYEKIDKEYPASFFTNAEHVAAQMYDDGRSYRAFVEATRHDTARGLVHGEVIDSVDNASERAFLDQALAYCRHAGIRVITKREAFHRCFDRPLLYGNLIRNPRFENTAAAFLPDALTMPANPDGYEGACRVVEDAGVRTLVTEGSVTNVLYGVPPGKLVFSACSRGGGVIALDAVKNATPWHGGTLERLGSLVVKSEDGFSEAKTSFVVPDNPETAYEQRCEGLGDKIMALRITFPAGLEIRSVRLERPSLTNRLLALFE